MCHYDMREFLILAKINVTDIPLLYIVKAVALLIFRTILVLPTVCGMLYLLIQVCSTVKHCLVGLSSLQ